MAKNTTHPEDSPPLAAMSRKTWCLPRQTRFFLDRKPEFVKYQASGELQTHFWPSTRAAFFAIWPDRETELAEEKELYAKLETTALPDAPGAQGAKKKGGKKSKKPREPKIYSTHDEWYKARTDVSTPILRLCETEALTDHGFHPANRTLVL